MHKIFLENRSIVICPPQEGCPRDSSEDILDKLGRFREGSSRDTIYIYAADPSAAYDLVRSRFREVNAGGGVVRNPAGQVLMIVRNGVWDLPKGHQEAGESILRTAIREVGEETGLDALESGSLICVTDHCYLREGEWCLKHTWWYNMLAVPDGDPSPQREEGISEAVWVEAEGLPACIGNTYPSIIEVLEQAGLV